MRIVKTIYPANMAVRWADFGIVRTGHNMVIAIMIGQMLIGDASQHLLGRSKVIANVPAICAVSNR